MDNTSHTSSVTLGSQVRRIFRHRLLILLSVVVFAVAGAAYGYMTNSKYTSKASLVVYPLVVDPAGTGSANSTKVDIATESRVASSREVAQNAAKSLIANGDTLSEAQLTSRLMSSVKVTGTSQTAVLDIEVTRPNGTDAAHYANAMANAYLQVRSESLKSSVDSAVHQIDEQISALEGDNGRVGLLSQLQERRVQIQLTSTTGGRVMSEAQIPVSSSALGPVKMAIVGAVAGLLIGAVLAYGRDRTMRHVGYADRLEDAGIPVHELGSSSESNDPFMLLRTIGAPDGDLKSAGASGIVILPGTDRGVEHLYQMLQRVMPTEYARFTDYASVRNI
ncbi:Wzz/FepE/Etk N-terminal domain-containing protein, partial [Rothia sp. 27098_8_161]|uniref:Wzz/FepE/Etk N-terminal domain-containing protein n=1 Tax=Rothia sp. 27098_8_161 TaxID=3003678 RepID=UPI00352E424A